MILAKHSNLHFSAHKSKHCKHKTITGILANLKFPRCCLKSECKIISDVIRHALTPHGRSIFCSVSLCVDFIMHGMASETNSPTLHWLKSMANMRIKDFLYPGTACHQNFGYYDCCRFRFNQFMLFQEIYWTKTQLGRTEEVKLASLDFFTTSVLWKSMKGREINSTSPFDHSQAAARGHFLSTLWDKSLTRLHDRVLLL